MSLHAENLGIFEINIQLQGLLGKEKDYPGESQKFSELWEFVVLNSTNSILDMSNFTEEIKKSKRKGTKKKKKGFHHR